MIFSIAALLNCVNTACFSRLQRRQSVRLAALGLPHTHTHTAPWSLG